MTYRLGLAQCGFPADGDVCAQVGRLFGEAAAQGVDLLVFPEDLMSPRPLTAEELRAQAEPLDGPFATTIAQLAAHQGIWAIFTMYERDEAGGLPFNTAVVMDDVGAIRATYRKCHRYDAHGVYESQRTKAGEQLLSPIATPFGRLGLGICYDLRFPEQARAAAVAGCDLLVFPSAWYDGEQKLAHWHTLLRSRAIENELFVAGACKAGERYVGQSMVADPLGRVLTCADGKSEQLCTCIIDVAEVAAAREAMPVLAHRRPELYR